MPDPARFVVKGISEDGRSVFWTAAMGTKYPQFLRDRARAYPMSLEGAREVATRFNVADCGLAGYRFDTEAFVLPA